MHPVALQPAHRPVLFPLEAEGGSAEAVGSTADREGPADRARPPASEWLRDCLLRQVAPGLELAHEGRATRLQHGRARICLFYHADHLSSEVSTDRMLLR